MKLTILLPCLNEALTLETCIIKAKKFLNSSQIEGEILVADNGSSDGSQEIAQNLGARLISVYQKGYGSALIGGIKEAKGEFIIMGDADDSYDFSELSNFVVKLEANYDLVMGNRFKGGIMPNAMPFLHRYLGNPVLSFLGKIFFNIKVNDFHCGLRGFKKSSIMNLDLRSTGMEFASEMVVKASLAKLKITEVPIKLYKDGRNRPPHLKTWSDGWRHLKFLLIFAPNFLFLLPGVFFFFVGFLISLLLVINPIEIGSIVFDVHTLLYTSFLTLIGLQCIFLYLFTKVFYYKRSINTIDEKFWLWFYRNFKLEKGLQIGFVVLVIGMTFMIYSVILWQKVSFGQLIPQQNLRNVIPACFLVFSGVQIIFNSFFYNILLSED